ncbi:MAG: AraC family transcriptional regulator [Cyanobacteria bacterium P01_F01_bin.53]
MSDATRNGTISLTETEFSQALATANRLVSEDVSCTDSSCTDSSDKAISSKAISSSLSRPNPIIAELQKEYDNKLRLEPNESLMMFPPALGRGYLRGIRLREGLDLGVQDYVLKQDLLIHGQNFSLQEACASLTFCISGQFNSTFPGRQSSLKLGAKEATFYTTPYAAGTIEFKAGDRIHFVDITLSPKLLRCLVGEDLARLPENLQKAIQANASKPSFHFCDISAEIDQALQKVVRCPYHGKIRSVYLESKALELIALYFSQFYQPLSPLADPLAGSTNSLKYQNYNRLQEAREFLKQNLMTPPSLAELSEKVGLNERNLQQGFRELFGTTVFGVLHDDRMDKARQLLESQQMSIGAIADTVGISHRGYFAKAFKRKFGSTPREYLKRLS